MSIQSKWLSGLFAACFCYSVFATTASVPDLQPYVVATPWASDDSQLNQTGLIEMPDDGYSKHYNFAANIDVLGDTMIVSGIGYEDSEQADSLVYLYRKDAQNQWQKIDQVVVKTGDVKLGINEFTPLELFDDKTFAIGMPLETVNSVEAAGAVYVYQRIATGNWSKKRLLSPVIAASESFGYTIEAHADHLLIASEKYTTGIATNNPIDHKVKLYRYYQNNGEWRLGGEVPLQNDTYPVRPFFTLHGNYLASNTGKYHTDSNGNTAFIHQIAIYQYANQTWQRIKTFDIDTLINDIRRILISDSVLIVTDNYHKFAYTTIDNWQTLSKTALPFGNFINIALHGDNIAIAHLDNHLSILTPYDNGQVKTWVEGYSINLGRKEYQGTISLGHQLAFINNQFLAGYYVRNMYNQGSYGAVYPFDFSLQRHSESVVAPNTPVNLSGIWYEPTFNGSGFDFSQLDQGFVGTFYGYKQYGSPLWLASEVLPQTLMQGETVQIPLYSGYEGNGGNFLHKPTVGNGVRLWGHLYLQMTACDKGIAVLDGDDGTKALRLQKLATVNGLDCQGNTTATNPFAISGTWYDPEFNGSGFVLTETDGGFVVSFYGYQHFNIRRSLDCWGTADCVWKELADGTLLWLVSDVIQDSAISRGKTYTATLYAPTQQGTFSVAPNDNNGVAAWGTLRLTFNRCNQATASITEHFTDPQTQVVSDYTVTHNLQRLATPQGIICSE